MSGDRDTARPNGIALSVAIVACFFLSGAASLVLEVVWSRLLRLVFGTTTLAIATILVAYMAGLGIGGLIGGRIAGRVRNGVRAYGVIEIVVGLYALAMPFVFSFFPEIARALLSDLSFWPSAMLRFALAFVVLCAPTIGMGMTLPFLTRALVRDEGEPEHPRVEVDDDVEVGREDLDPERRLHRRLLGSGSGSGRPVGQDCFWFPHLSWGKTWAELGFVPAP